MSTDAHCLPAPQSTAGRPWVSLRAKARALALLSAATLFGSVPAAAVAQDLYDVNTLRTIAIQFNDANWLQLLRQNYASETNILATVTVDGVNYPNVGVRIRGNTSYTALPVGSEKFSLKLEFDFVDPNQELMGYDTVNLNNGFRDPTFTREVVYNNYVAQFVPNPRANHVLLTLNGQNWGVYNNIQQPDKRMLRDYFANADGARISCQNNPNGPGLSYNGANASGYSGYTVNNAGGFVDPIVDALIPVTNAVTNGALATWPTIDNTFAIDPSIWSVVLENLLTDDDSYVNKGCDFIVYRNPVDGRTHLLQRDANETFSQANWTITRNFTATNKPVLSRLLSVPELRQRYMAHYRVASRNLNWTYFGPIFTAHRNRIAAHVQADPKKIYTFALFEQNFTSTVNLGQPGLAGGTLVGLQTFVQDRASFLNPIAELQAQGPTVSEVRATIDTPTPSTPVFITARALPSGSSVAQVRLHYRPNAQSRYLDVAMLDNGASGDGAAGDGVYGAQLPVTGTPGLVVPYYVAATAANTFQSMSFGPELAERGPRSVEYSLGSAAGMRITEWMYAGTNGEFIEFTNVSGAPIDMTGWSMDDSNAVPGAFSLSAFGVVQPGESVLVTDSTEALFRSAWSLPAARKIIGSLGAVGVGGNNLGRNDEIHLYNASGGLVDRLQYGDQTYAGSIRTQNISGQAPCHALAANDVYSWRLSGLGDAFGSLASAGNDLGTPGSFTAILCDPLYVNGFE